jgi:cytochrome c-type biogenesis protein CcsB
MFTSKYYFYNTEMSRKNLRFVFMKNLLFFDYQLPIFASLVLFFAMVTYWVSLYFPKNRSVFKLGKGLIIISNLLFAATLAIRWITEGYFPLSNLYESLIFLSWGISMIHLVIEYQTKSRLLGAISSPILFFLSGFSSLTLPTDMQKALPLVPSLQSNWLMMHVSMMMISYSTLIIGSLFSIIYLAFSFFKKEDKTYSVNATSNDSSLVTSTNVSQMSLLQTVDIWSYRIIGLGFPFLTLGIISGAVWANEAWGSYWSWDPKETWALITWLTFATYLHSRLLKGWQGKNAAILGSLGFFVIWVCYLGVNFLGKGLHSYGWVL